MRFAEIFKTELFSKYGQKAGCYINEIYDIIKQNHLLASVILRIALSELCSRYNKKKNTTYRTKRIIMLDFLEKNMEGGRRKDGIAPYPIF